MKDSLRYILSDYKRVLKENEQLRTEVNSLNKENEELNKENEELHREINKRIKLKIENEKIVDTQFIYKQKIKDKIKEIVEKIKHEENEKVVIYLSKQKNILQELLESEE